MEPAYKGNVWTEQEHIIVKFNVAFLCFLWPLTFPMDPWIPYMYWLEYLCMEVFQRSVKKTKEIVIFVI